MKLAIPAIIKAAVVQKVRKLKVGRFVVSSEDIEQAVSFLIGAALDPEGHQEGGRLGLAALSFEDIPKCLFNLIRGKAPGRLLTIPYFMDVKTHPPSDFFIVERF
jgi:hypothetical protein